MMSIADCCVLFVGFVCCLVFVVGVDSWAVVDVVVAAAAAVVVGVILLILLLVGAAGSVVIVGC